MVYGVGGCLAAPIVRPHVRGTPETTDGVVPSLCQARHDPEPAPCRGCLYAVLLRGHPIHHVVHRVHLCTPRGTPGAPLCTTWYTGYTSVHHVVPYGQSLYIHHVVPIPLVAPRGAYTSSYTT